MSLKARIARLEREVDWLRYEGWVRSLELRMKLMQQMTALESHKAAQKAKEKAPRPRLSAGRARLQSRVSSGADGSRHRSGAPPAPEAPRPEEPREARRLEGPGAGATLAPSLRDASLRDAPQGEVVVGPERPPPPPVEPPFVYDPPEHMQIRPVTWRLRTAEDDWDDDDDDLGPYQVLTEYDPLDDS